MKILHFVHLKMLITKFLQVQKCFCSLKLSLILMYFKTLMNQKLYKIKFSYFQRLKLDARLKQYKNEKSLCHQKKDIPRQKILPGRKTHYCLYKPPTTFYCTESKTNIKTPKRRQLFNPREACKNK